MFRRRRRRVVEETAAPPPVRRRPLIWPWLLLLLLLVIGGLALGYFLTREDDDESQSSVPDVVGFNERMAVDRLDRAGYTAEVRRQLNPNRQAGRVFDQEPDAGAELESGADVVIFVARGRGSVRVPRVRGLPVSEAFERLQAARLRGEAREVFSGGSPGTVIRQEPTAGTEVPRGASVALTVSKGRRTIAVPNLVGLSEAEAGAALQRLGLRANVARVPTSEPAGTVVAQRPAAGQQTRRGAVVQINVSRGAPAVTQTTVPDVRRQEVPTAHSTLRAAGFSVRTVERPTTDPAEDGIVLEQTPRGGQRVPRRSQVTIVVGSLS